MSSAMTTISKMRLIWSSIQGLAAVQSFAKLKLVWRMYVWAWNAGKRSSKDRQKHILWLDIARRVLLQYLASKQNFVLNSRDSSSEWRCCGIADVSVKRERPHHLHDRSHVWHLQNKVGISFSNRWSLPSGQIWTTRSARLHTVWNTYWTSLALWITRQCLCHLCST